MLRQVVLLAIIGAILNQMSAGKTQNIFGIIAVVFLIFYALTLIFAYIATQYVMVARFYRSMFTDEGYLTHTLPVKPWQLLLSNTLVYFIVSILDILVLVGSFLLWIMPILNPAELGVAISTVADAWGMSIPAMALAVIGNAIIGIFSIIGGFYFAVCVGSLFAPRKVLASVITYILMSVINQVISMVAVLTGATRLVDSASTSFVSVKVATGVDSAIVQNFMNNSIDFAFILSLVFCVIYFGVSQYVISKKLNLE